MYTLIRAVVCCLIISSCSIEKIPVVIANENDYQWALALIKDESLNHKREQKIQEEISFWNEQIAEKGSGFIYMEKLGGLYARLFEVTGKLSHIHASNDFYKSALNQTGGNYKSKLLLALSSNAVKLHQFNTALDYSTQAFALAKNKFGPALMAFDAAMEIGNYSYASEIMDQYENMESFDYLVRYAKYLDHKGALDSAIDAMEKANELSKKSNEELYIWSLSGLAEMYGHHGQIQKSYDTFLEVLTLNPYDLHALKSIAWIAYSHDGNVDSAIELLDVVSKATALPDAFLMIAEITQNETHRQEALEKFLQTAEREEYKNLYASLLSEIYIEENHNIDQALEMALQEVHNRSTPHTLIKLAKVYTHTKQSTKALEIVYGSILNRTHEPDILYNTGIILMENGETNNAKKLLREAREAAFELGPLKVKDIDKRLKMI